MNPLRFVALAGLLLASLLAPGCTGELPGEARDGSTPAVDGSVTPPTDSGTPTPKDSGTTTVDAGTPDSGTPDAGAPDAGTPDAGPNCALSLPSFAPTYQAVRGSDQPVISRGSYDYAPSVMHDGRYRMWWCGGVAGDHILYAEADSLGGPWYRPGTNTPGSVSVLTPTGVPGTFDRSHTCDPSVIRVEGKYYMYYGGLEEEESNATKTTRLGVATSPDGLNWTRQNGGNPIVVPNRIIPNNYGAGQPSVTYVDGLFYLLYMDGTGLDSNPVNHAGEYVLRSADPLFLSGVEELTATGFQPRTNAIHTTRSLTEAFSVDWQYIDSLDAFVVATPGYLPGVAGNSATELRFFDRNFNALGKTYVPGFWREGPGLVGRPDRHAIPTPDCGRLSMDVIHANGTDDVNGWNLTHAGADILTGRSCACVDFGKVYEGSLISSPGKPLTMVHGGRRLQFGRAEAALRLARASYEVSDALFHAFPYGASMPAGVPAVSAPNRPGAFILDDNRVYPFDCLELVSANQSPINTISTADFDSHAAAPALRCIR